MKLVRVKRVLLKRLAWLNAKIATGASPPLEEERDALDTLLRCQGMLDDEAVAYLTDRCLEVVVPAERRMKARARRGDELLERIQSMTAQLTAALHGSVGRPRRDEEGRAA